MSTYHWEWQQGDGPHIWLRDTSDTLRNQTGSRTLGLIDPCDEGWKVQLWKVHSFSETVAVLPKTMAAKDVKATAKLILLSLKESNHGT